MSDARGAQFADLDSVVAAWGLSTVRQRREKRLRSNYEELKAFHDAMLPRLEAVIAFLDQFPPDGIPEPFLPLSYAALAMCEVDDPVSKWRSVLLDDALDPRRFVIKKNFFDTARSPRNPEEPT
jgi:hypothetical protein